MITSKREPNMRELINEYVKCKFFAFEILKKRFKLKLLFLYACGWNKICLFYGIKMDKRHRTMSNKSALQQYRKC